MRRLGMGRYRSVFGGITLGDGGVYVVHLTRLDASVEADFRAVARHQRLAFRRTANNLARLDAMMETLKQQWDAIIASGTKLNAFGPDEQTGRLDVTVVDLTPRDTAQFVRMFGAANIRLHSITQEQADSIRAY